MRVSIIAFASLCACATPVTPVPVLTPVSPEPGRGLSGQGHEDLDLKQLVADFCGRDVVLLGEPDHGGGRTWEVKTWIVRRLIESCGFDSVFIESGIYDFLTLEHAYSEGTATFQDLSNATGALWSEARETQPWIAYLHTVAKAGTVKVTGIDDQIHSTAFFAQKWLPKMLATYLPDGRKEECETTMGRHTAWKYDEEHSYSERDQADLLECLKEVQNAISSQDRSTSRAEALIMASSLSRWISRDFGMDKWTSIGARDSSMFENFRWHRERLGPKSKSIVWCATVHAAKDSGGLGQVRGFVPLGRYIHQQYGDRAASIGFSAYGGASRMRGHDVRELPVASPDSLEGQALAPGQELRYLNANALRALGIISARPIGHEFYRERWHEVLDGLVVFRREEPAHHQRATGGGY